MSAPPPFALPAWRRCLLWLLLAVLPLQSTAGLARLVQGQRHVHVANVAVETGPLLPAAWAQTLRGWLAPLEPLLSMGHRHDAAHALHPHHHVHDGTPHHHDPAEPGVLVFGDGGDESTNASSAALAWLPLLPAGLIVHLPEGREHLQPAGAERWRDHLSPPPHQPPRAAVPV